MTQNEYSTVIFHISMRPSENAIVRNTFQNGYWGHEERDGHYHVRANERFDISITAEHSHYRLSLNHKHFASFNHRMPLQMVQFYQISGDVTIDEIRIDNGIVPSVIPQAQTVTSYTTVTPSVPMPMPMPAPIVVTNIQARPSAPPPPYNPLYPMNLNVDLHYDSRNQHHGHHGHPQHHHGHHGHNNRHH